MHGRSKGSGWSGFGRTSFCGVYSKCACAKLAPTLALIHEPRLPGKFMHSASDLHGSAAAQQCILPELTNHVTKHDIT